MGLNESMMTPGVGSPKEEQWRKRGKETRIRICSVGQHWLFFDQQLGKARYDYITTTVHTHHYPQVPTW